MHRHFFETLSQIPEYFQTHCSDRRNPFLFANRKLYLYNYPRCWYSMKTPIQIQINV